MYLAEEPVKMKYSNCSGFSGMLGIVVFETRAQASHSLEHC